MFCILTVLDRIKPKNEVFEISASSNKTFWNDATYVQTQFDRRNLQNCWEGRLVLTQPKNLLKLQVRKQILINTTGCNLNYYESESRLVQTLQMYELQTTYRYGGIILGT